VYNTYAGKSDLKIFRQLKFTLFIPESPPKVFSAYLSTTLLLPFFCPVQKKGNNAFDRAVCSVLSPLSSCLKFLHLYFKLNLFCFRFRRSGSRLEMSGGREGREGRGEGGGGGRGG
jgi:hypothetical protein